MLSIGEVKPIATFIFYRHDAIQEHEREIKRNDTKQTAESIDPFDYHKHTEQKYNHYDDGFQYEPFYTSIDSRCTGHSNLNSILESLECTNYGQKCVAESKEAWHDFQSAIEYVVFKTWDRLFLYWSYIDDSVDSKAARDSVIENLLCPTEGAGHTTPGEGLITKVFDLVNAHMSLETDPSKEMDYKLIRLLASVFRRPLPDTIKTVTSYIETNYPTYEYVSDLSECHEIAGNMSITDFVKMARFVDAAALVSRHYIRDELRLGNLLLHAYIYSDSTDYFESLEFMKSLQDILKHYSEVIFSEHNQNISPRQIIDLNFPTLPDMFCKYKHRLEERGWPIDESTTCDIKYQTDKLPPLQIVLKLMKYLVLPTSKYFSQKSEYKDVQKFKQLFSSKNYTLSKMAMTHEDFTILACKINDEEMSSAGNCDIFSKSYTTDGIGYVFNGLPFFQMYKGTKSNLAFYKEFVERQDKSEYEHPILIEAHGESFSLDFYVRHKAYAYDKGKRNSQAVKLALHDSMSLPNLKAEGIELQPGNYYEISITPTVTTTVESGLKYNPEKRNCLSRSENEGLTVFNSYSQTACIFECQLTKALEVCNCTAWDYPKVSQPANLCTGGEGIKCFEFVMGRPMKPQYCNCHNDCDYVHYDISLNVKNLDDYDDTELENYSQ